LREIPPMWLMDLVLAGGYLAFFVRFCALLLRVSLRGGGWDEFSDVFFHGICPLDDCFDCALLGKNGRQGSPGFLGVYVACFVGV